MEPKYSGLKIVIVDDSPTCLKKIRTSLERSGLFNRYNIFTFELPLNAYAFLKEHKADLVLSDYCMPEMTGEYLCKKIKDIYPDIKLILFSSSVKDLQLVRESVKGIVNFFIEEKKEDCDFTGYIEKLFA